MRTNSMNVVVTALGAAVSGLGFSLMRREMKSKVGPGLLGFGLAHVTLGLLDMNRPSVDDDSIQLDFDNLD